MKRILNLGITASLLGISSANEAELDRRHHHHHYQPHMDHHHHGHQHAQHENEHALIQSFEERLNALDKDRSVARSSSQQHEQEDFDEKVANLGKKKLSKAERNAGKTADQIKAEKEQKVQNKLLRKQEIEKEKETEQTAEAFKDYDLEDPDNLNKKDKHKDKKKSHLQADADSDLEKDKMIYATQEKTSTEKAKDYFAAGTADKTIDDATVASEDDKYGLPASKNKVVVTKKTPPSNHKQSLPYHDPPTVSSEPVDPFEVKEASFSRDYDHLGHNHGLNKGYHVQIQKLRDLKSEAKCALNDWIEINWKGFDTTGKLVFDSKQINRGRTQWFRLGHYEVSKCWDIALQQLSQGEVAEVYCPAEMDLGGSTDVYSHVDDLDKVQGATDMNYIFEVKQCGLMVEDKGPQRVMGPLQDGRCFFMVPENPDARGNFLAIEASQEDQYAPRSTGVFNIGIHHWHGTGSTNLLQQWMYDSKRQALTCLGHSSIMFEGFNKNLVVFRDLGMANQKFKYDHHHKRFTNVSTGNAIDLMSDNFADKVNVVTEPVDTTPGQRWDIFYCDNPEGNRGE